MNSRCHGCTLTLIRHNTGLNQCVTVPLADHERAALLSFTFNLGVSRVCHSTLMARVNRGELPAACAEISRWNRVANRNCELLENADFCGGIVRRRAAERAMCEGRYIGAPGSASSGAAA